MRATAAAADAAEIPGKGKQFFPAAAEQQRVAALQPHHALAGARGLDQGLGDARLRPGRVALALADIDQRRVRARHAQHGAAGQRIVEDDIRGAQRAGGAQGQQIGIARASADQPDGTRRGAVPRAVRGAFHIATSRSSPTSAWN
jgi:hypothetical protein